MTRVIAAIERFLVRTGFLAAPEQSAYCAWADCRLDELAAELRRSRQAHPMQAGLDRAHDALMDATTQEARRA